MLPLTALLLIYSTILVPENYHTIQEAVTKASSGDVIIVGEGIYKENVLITKPITVKSIKGPDSTKVMAADSARPVFMVKNADNVHITGFTVTGSVHSGIYLSDSKGGTVSNNRSERNGIGIFLRASINNALTENLAASNDKYGIYLESSNRNTLKMNRANTNADKGIFLSSSHENILTDNGVNLNAWNGILLWGSNNNTLQGNRVWRNRFGIVDSGGSNNKMVNNSSWSNIYIIMPLILAYLGIVSYLLQKRLLRNKIRA